MGGERFESFIVDYGYQRCRKNSKISIGKFASLSEIVAAALMDSLFSGTPSFPFFSSISFRLCHVMQLIILRVV